MMAKLDTLLNLEQKKEDKLRVDFIQAEQYYTQQKQKLDGLNQFRFDYAKQLHDKGASGVTGGGYTQYQAFISKIEDAISGQTTAVNRAKQVREQRFGLWTSQQAKTKAIAKLIEKQALALEHKRRRQEQSVLDEFAATQFVRRKASMNA